MKRSQLFLVVLQAFLFTSLMAQTTSNYGVKRKTDYANVNRANSPHPLSGMKKGAHPGASGASTSNDYTETVLYSFTGASGDGANPRAGLIMDSAGNLYGTTMWGGDEAGPYTSGCGTVFKLDSSGQETVLYSFTHASGDGANPEAGLIMDSAGNLYGTTMFGGSGQASGTVFEVTPAGQETVLYSFTDANTDGAAPQATLITDTAGNLYGTTLGGGNIAGLCGYGGVSGCGTVFKFDSSGQETVLYSFTGVSGDGANPEAGLIMDSTGNLYGTTMFGGNLASSCSSSGCGTVFKLDSSGQETVLYSFTGANGDGEDPDAGLIMDNAGNLYGTTYGGGSANEGTVFKVTPAGVETVLYSFTGANGDGTSPQAGLIMDSAGNLYGTTATGGSADDGTVFEVTPAGVETVLHSFKGGNVDGASPQAGLIMDSAGNLYGTTWNGGSADSGTVFKIVPVPDFTVSPSALSTGSVTPGQSATSTISLTSVNGFNSAVNLTCSVSPSPSLAPTCAFSTDSVTPAANGTATSTLTISTTAATASLTPAADGRGSKFLYALWLPMPIMVLLGAGRGHSSKWLRMFLGLVLAAGVTGQLACGGSSNNSGGGGNSGTPAGNYTITVTATSGSTSHTTTVQLSVQ